MKRKYYKKQNSKKTFKKVLIGVGAGVLALGALAGGAWALNNRYEWVELPTWLTVPEKEVLQELHVKLPASLLANGTPVEIDFNGPAILLGSLHTNFYKGFEFNEDFVLMKFDTKLIEEPFYFQSLIIGTTTNEISYYFEEIPPLFGLFDFTKSEIVVKDGSNSFTDPEYSILYV